MSLFSKSCESTVRLNGQTFVVTGANTGLGKETTRDLYWRGARVILACRNLSKASAAIEDVKKTPPSKHHRTQFAGEPGSLSVTELDLNSLASVKKCAKHISLTESSIHGLINNAGVMMCPKGTTDDGFEIQFGCNHLGHFLLTLLLLPKILRSRNESASCCRIVNVSSMAHQYGVMKLDDLMMDHSYSPTAAYCQSKLANVLFTRELARRLKEAGIGGVNVYALHPGVIPTELVRHLNTTVFWGFREIFCTVANIFCKTPELGAQTTIHCAVDENAAKETGLYYKECAVSAPGAVALNETLAAKLWDESVKLVGLRKNDDLAAMIEQISEDMESRESRD